MSRKFPMDLSKFKKIKVDEVSTTLRHPEGHEFKIAHKAINPEMRQQLDALPHLDGGGTVTNPDGSTVDPNKYGSSKPDKPDARKAVSDYFTSGYSKKPSSATASTGYNEAHGGMIPHYAGGSPDGIPETPPPTAEPTLADKAAKYLEATPGFGASVDNSEAPPASAPAPQPAEPTPPTPSAPSAPQDPQQSQSMDPYGTAESQKDLTQGIGLQNTGFKGQADAAAAMGKAQADTLLKAIDQQQQQQSHYQDNLKNISDEHDALMHDIQNAHIDPRHYVGSMETVPKITTAIGLLLGGMGAGLTGGSNPAMDYLNSQIDRDIDAQKANLGKKESLLSANMRHYGNLRDAMDATRAGMQGIVNMQIQQAAAKSSGPNAKAIAQVQQGQLQQQTAGLLGQMAARKTLLNSQSQGGQARDPYAVIRTLVPEHEQEATNKELKEAQAVTKSAANIQDAFNRVKQISALSNRLANPIQSGRQIKALTDPLVAQLSKETAGRFTEQDAKYLGTLFPATGDSDETIRTKQNQIQKLISEKMNFPKLKFYGIDPTGRAPNSAKYDSKFKK